MAKPYREGKGWAVRVRCQGQDIYLKGYDSEAAARHAAEAQRVAHDREHTASLGRTSTRGGLERFCRGD